MMRLPELGEGVVIGVGATNYRVGEIDINGELQGPPDIVPTPETSTEFFAQTGRSILDAAHNGAKWAVVGVPGPVSVKVDADDRVDQRLRVTNIPALSRKEGFDPITEMVASDPAVGDLLASDDFTFLTVNDGDLAVQAGAELFGVPYDVIADVIDGSGTGGAVARRDTRFPDQHLFHPDPGLWEIGQSPFDLSFPSRTLETTISGLALEKHLGKPVHELRPRDPAFDEIARGIGYAAINLGINAGAELVVVSGGIGIGSQKYFKKELQKILLDFSRSRNPMADKVPDIKFPHGGLVNDYELYGAHGSMLSHLTRRAIDQLVIKTVH